MNERYQTWFWCNERRTFVSDYYTRDNPVDQMEAEIKTRKEIKRLGLLVRKVQIKPFVIKPKDDV